MVIDISDEQGALLRDLIDSRLSNLSSEIRHTDRASMRQGLREEREVLRSLMGLLAPESVDA